MKYIADLHIHSKYSRATSKDLDLENIPSGTKVKLGGFLSSLRMVVTKKNNSEMAFATLEDGTGKIDLVIFPKTYASFREFIIKDKVVITEGKLEVREEGLSMVLDKVYTLNAETEEKFDFVLRVPKGTNSKSLMELNKILRENPGGKRGMLIFENGNGGKKKLELNFGVDFNRGLEEQIESILKNQLI